MKQVMKDRLYPSLAAEAGYMGGVELKYYLIYLQG